MLFIYNLLTLCSLTSESPPAQQSPLLPLLFQIALPQLGHLYLVSANEASSSASPLLDLFISLRSFLLFVRLAHAVPDAKEGEITKADRKLMQAFWPSCEGVLLDLLHDENCSIADQQDTQVCLAIS